MIMGHVPSKNRCIPAKKSDIPTQSGDLHGDSQVKAAILSDFLAQHGDFQTASQELKSIERLERAPERNLSAGAQGGDEPGEAF